MTCKQAAPRALPSPRHYPPARRNRREHGQRSRRRRTGPAPPLPRHQQHRWARQRPPCARFSQPAVRIPSASGCPAPQPVSPSPITPYWTTVQFRSWRCPMPALQASGQLSDFQRGAVQPGWNQLWNESVHCRRPIGGDFPAFRFNWTELDSPPSTPNPCTRV